MLQFDIWEHTNIFRLWSHKFKSIIRHIIDKIYIFSRFEMGCVFEVALFYGKFANYTIHLYIHATTSDKIPLNLWQWCNIFSKTTFMNIIFFLRSWKSISSAREIFLFLAHLWCRLECMHIVKCDTKRLGHAV